MESHEYEHCFEKRYTTKGNKGSGFGLYFSKIFMYECHGSIKVESVKGMGSIFTLIFPVGKKSTTEKEMRKESRMLCEFECLVETSSILGLFSDKDENQIVGTAINISSNGLGLKLNRQLRVNQKIKIIYGKKPSTGIVKWVEHENGTWRAGIQLQ